MIYELLTIVRDLHVKKYIIRDLRETNLMSDINKSLVMIDFDRVETEEYIRNYDEVTRDICSDFSSPEVCESGEFSYSGDVYSLEKVIQYITDSSNIKFEHNFKFD